jgi:hypothetical protein
MLSKPVNGYRRQIDDKIARAAKNKQTNKNQSFQI